MTALTTQIIIIVVSLLVALGVGLLLRFLLVRRLKKTVLDNWLNPDIRLSDYHSPCDCRNNSSIVLYWHSSHSNALLPTTYTTRHIQSAKRRPFHLESRFERTYLAAGYRRWANAYEIYQWKSSKRAYRC